MSSADVVGRRIDTLRDAVEPDVRRLVAEQLGVSPEDLTPAVSLTEDLAADSLDVVELGLALEAEFPIALSHRSLMSVRTYAELVDTVATSLVAQRRTARRAAPPPLPARVRVVPPASAGTRGSLERWGTLTPYDVEILFADALRAGPGARLEMELQPGTADADLAATRVRLAPLAARGVEVSIRRRAHA
jgi:acyl carrier protein